jgi:putative two-component system response regulator
MKKRILIVDCSFFTLREMDVKLSPHFDMMLASGESAAINICKKEKPDLIILDTGKELAGFNTIRKLKQITYLENTPFIFLSKSDSIETKASALELGALDYFTKPLDLNALIGAINEHFNVNNEHQKIPEDKETVSGQNNENDNTKNDHIKNFIDWMQEVIEYKSEYQNHHGLETAIFTAILGKELRRQNVFPAELNDEVLADICAAAVFHDIGKIGIRDKVYLKKTSLTETEKAEYKNHTIIGAKLIARLKAEFPEENYLHYAEAIAFGHHEHIDGSGYPQGLQGDEIPLCCRIVTVANVYASKTNRRHNKARMTHEKASDYILKGRGAKYDARVVDCFRDVNDRFGEMLAQISGIELVRGEK